MDFYFLIGLLTVGFVAVAVSVWQKTGSAAFMMGAFFLYYWTLFGAWHIVYSLETGKDTPYLFYKVFPIYLDSDYRNALLLYGVFIMVVMATVLCFAEKPRRDYRSPILIEIEHWKILATGAACGLVGYLLVRSALGSIGESAYAAARNLPGYSIFQILNHGALTVTAIGLATWMTGRRARFIVARRSWLDLAGYTVVLGALFILMVRMGNRGEAALTIALLLLMYMANTVRPNKLLLGGIAAVGLVVVMVVKLARDSLLGAGSGMNAMGLLERTKSEIFESTESVAAHLSMYGALHKHLPLTWGTSFSSLVASIIPRSIWADRPNTIYEYYASGVAAIEGQGYTIHHATGWYLNFGIPGLIAGGFLLGLCWAKLHNMVYEGRVRRSAFGSVFAIVAFWCFSSGLPDILRNGPEVYKTVLISQLLLPALLITMCSARLVLRDERPTVIFQRRVVTKRTIRRVTERGLAVAGGQK